MKNLLKIIITSLLLTPLMVGAVTVYKVSQGGTGVGTITGLIKGNGTSAFSSAVAGTDYVIPSTLYGYVPYTGATGNVDLGVNKIDGNSTTQTIGNTTDKIATTTFVNQTRSFGNTLKMIGSIIKVMPLGYNMQYSSTGTSMVDGTAYYVLLEPAYEAITATGVKALSGGAGNFINDNFNGVALYEVNGDGTYTQVAISDNLPNNFKQSTGSTVTFPFLTPYILDKNKMYVIGILYNSSSQTTAPTLYVAGSASGNISNFLSPTIAKTAGLKTGSNTLLSGTFNISTLSINTSPFLVTLY